MSFVAPCLQMCSNQPFHSSTFCMLHTFALLLPQVRSMHDALLMLLKSPVDAVRRAAGEGLALLATNMGTVYQVLGSGCGW